MVDIAQAEERVILTCDRTFIRMGYSDQAFYVRTTNKQEQVKEVLAHFNITVREDSLLSRCAKCNGTFFPRYADDVTASSFNALCEAAQWLYKLHRLLCIVQLVIRPRRMWCYEQIYRKPVHIMALFYTVKEDWLMSVITQF